MVYAPDRFIFPVHDCNILLSVGISDGLLGLGFCSRFHVYVQCCTFLAPASFALYYRNSSFTKHFNWLFLVASVLSFRHSLLQTLMHSLYIERTFNYSRENDLRVLTVHLFLYVLCGSSWVPFTCYNFTFLYRFFITNAVLSTVFNSIITILLHAPQYRSRTRSVAVPPVA
jgi:hypothetical protein